MSTAVTVTTNFPARETSFLAMPSIVHLEKAFKNAATEDAAIDATVDAILRLLVSFSDLPSDGSDFHTKESFGPHARQYVAAKRQIEMVLPAFPGKSKNTAEKVLGHLPDLGEEIALARLHDLCRQIKQLYEPGAKMIIATDGACYNDILEYTEDELWEYDSVLRQMVAKAGYDCFEFIHFLDLVGVCAKPTITKEEFMDLLEPARQVMMEKYLPQHFDVDKAISSDPNMKCTYLAYCKFLTRDFTKPLKERGYSGKGIKRKVHDTAKALITRGAAFAEAIRQRYPDCVRLSIHASNGKTKIPIRLIPSPDSESMTPWHCSVAVDICGTFRTGHVTAWKDTHELVYKDGRPYHFRERSPLYEWDAKVEFEHLYEGGLIVHNTKGSEQTKQSLSASDKNKAVSLALLQGKIIFQGF
ncbi:pyoverdine/dityrosine biosynthesis protein [Colletotrichum graminicola]|uniref:Pyoverdine/dityrosine biosynthesis protein n=1 Tax=Colletotrichum graminicola (strain M1.001 / M2 / FGSC 10212) TaxID=645133 RepID=E3QTD9_COLGM|nr:pyoverdine/dityrosine biosynthesis protein [Colletotrichum graminicola M1.001]EFQ34127.1 pyoverdine/dityrosine biosynthesis protein [Colletotrichum graminicola M1.001]WDK20904.1 pyoverdine/dityrosine biosynthesis protein [Colletotrichum graminicola]